MYLNNCQIPTLSNQKSDKGSLQRSANFITVESFETLMVYCQILDKIVVAIDDAECLYILYHILK